MDVKMKECYNAIWKTRDKKKYESSERVCSGNDTLHGSCQKIVKTRPCLGKRATRCILIIVKLLMCYSLRQTHVSDKKSQQKLKAFKVRLLARPNQHFRYILVTLQQETYNYFNNCKNISDWKKKFYHADSLHK